jgi:hypothetical protein
MLYISDFCGCHQEFYTRDDFYGYYQEFDARDDFCGCNKEFYTIDEFSYVIQSLKGLKTLELKGRQTKRHVEQYTN